MPRKHIWIGDPHAHPEYDNNRFTALGKLILEEQPEVVGCIGDLADMPSLSSYDRGTKSFEGRRYIKDVRAVQDAQKKLFAPINKYNNTKSKWKKKQYNPDYIMTMGNHEDRIYRALNLQPELEEVVDVSHLDYEKYGWQVHKFGDKVFVDGVAFSHYFASGVLGRPIGGERVGANLVNKNLMSSVQGHSHTFDHTEKVRADGVRIHGVSIGCFVHPDYVETWCAKQRHLWWEGIVILDHVENGDFLLRRISTKELMSNYG